MDQLSDISGSPASHPSSANWEKAGEIYPNNGSPHDVLQLDDCIEDLQRSSLEAKRRHNSIVPISRLSDDVLLEIFLYLRDHYILRVLLVQRYKADPKWINVSYVCHAWRAAALSYAALWTTPQLSNPALALEMARRSRDSPLHIFYYEHRKQTVDLPKLLGSLDLSRTKFASIDFTAKTHNDWVEPCINLLAPYTSELRSLSLSCQRSIWGHMLDHSFPQLHTLCLRGGPGGWDSVLLKSASRLRRLHLEYYYDGAVRPRFDDILETFRNLSQLQHLSIIKCLPLPCADSLSRHTTHTVDMPCLTDIHLRGMAEDCIFLIHHLTLPPTCTVDVSSYGTPQDTSAGCGLLESAFSGQPSKITVEVDDRRTIVSTYMHLSSRTPHWNIDLGRYDPLFTDAWLRAVSSYWTRLTTTTPIPTLELDTMDTSSPESWRALLGDCRVEELAISIGDDMHQFCAVLAEKGLPHLPRLVIKDLNLHDFPENQIHVLHILDELVIRAAEGVFAEIRLEECRVPDELLGEWKARTPGILWSYVPFNVVQDLKTSAAAV